MKKTLFLTLFAGCVATADVVTEDFNISSPESSVSTNQIYDLAKDWTLTVKFGASPEIITPAGKTVNIISSSELDIDLGTRGENTLGHYEVKAPGSSTSTLIHSTSGGGIESFNAAFAEAGKPVILTLAYLSDNKTLKITLSFHADPDSEGTKVNIYSKEISDVIIDNITTGVTFSTDITQELMDTDGLYSGIMGSWVLPYGTFEGFSVGTVPGHTPATTVNGRAGMALLSAAYQSGALMNNSPDGAMYNAILGATTEREMAAVAGASSAVVGQALNRDVERQLGAIRNRVAFGYAGHDTMTIQKTDEKGAPVCSAETKPHTFRVWVNAEGNRAEQDADNTAAGYTLSSWGATLGAGMQVNDKLSIGLALTSMFGDLKSDGPDYLEGDMDTSYLSAFAGYNSGKWSHALIGTIGVMEADMNRSVSHSSGCYSNFGETDGLGMGLMYEVSRAYALKNGSSVSPVFNISYRHTEVDAYTESGSDAALNVGEQSLDTVTVGLGARYAATLGQQTLNCACAFEARALAKYDFGDTQSDTSVGFINHATRANIESAEMGAFGVELGTGVSVPVGGGSIFADAEVELRSDYTYFNASVGYQYTF